MFKRTRVYINNHMSVRSATKYSSRGQYKKQMDFINYGQYNSLLTIISFTYFIVADFPSWSGSLLIWLQREDKKKRSTSSIPFKLRYTRNRVRQLFPSSSASQQYSLRLLLNVRVYLSLRVHPSTKQPWRNLSYGVKSIACHLL